MTTTNTKYDNLLGSIVSLRRANNGPKKGRTKNIIFHTIKYFSTIDCYEVCGYVVNDTDNGKDSKTQESWMMNSVQLDSLVSNGIHSFGLITWEVLSR